MEICLVCILNSAKERQRGFTATNVIGVSYIHVDCPQPSSSLGGVSAAIIVYNSSHGTLYQANLISGQTLDSATLNTKIPSRMF
jgi:hypothetical protein